MPGGIVLAGGCPTPTGWREWHGSPLLRRVCGLVARGTGGPVVVVRSPGQVLPALPEGVRVVEDERGGGPLHGLLAGLRATDTEVAFVVSDDLPLLHPRYVAAVCAAAGADGADVAVPRVEGRDQPLAAAYRPALAPLVAALVEAGERTVDALLVRARTYRFEEVPHPESVGAPAAPDAPQPRVRVRHIGPARRPPAALRAATLAAAGAAVGVTLGDHVLAALNGARVARDPLEPLAEGDDIAFMAAGPGG